ncbi:MAG: GNAT family N-acetyltransferase [Chloroflexi bacterium]|nr:GNAT family N-acetyltransferase [Chloroflexota bacterium]
MIRVLYRLIREEDYPVVTSMYQELDTYLRSLNVRLPEPEDPRQTWLDSFTRTLGKFSQVHVAEIDGAVAGFMLSRVRRVPEYWGGVLVGALSDMWVVPEARRFGVGRELSRLAINWLRDQGVHSVELQIVSDNVASLKLYDTLGFKHELIQVRMLWDDYLEPPPPDNAAYE